MAEDSQYLDLYRQALDALMSDAALDAEDEKYIDRAAAGLMRIIKRRSGAAMYGPVGDSRQQQLPPRTYDGLSVAEAAVAYFQTLPEKEVKTATEIVEHLVGAGYEFSTEHPDGALGTALRRRAGNYRDVVQVKRGVWAPRDWYTQREITEFSHRERTIAGMEAAKARGVKMGSGWGITAEQAADIKRRLEAGEKQAAIAREYGCAANTIHRYKKLLTDWSPGDPFPPKSQKEDGSDDRPKLREVK